VINDSFPSDEAPLLGNEEQGANVGANKMEEKEKAEPRRSTRINK
jgi:hypothetical protein